MFLVTWFQWSHNAYREMLFSYISINVSMIGTVQFIHTKRIQCILHSHSLLKSYRSMGIKSCLSNSVDHLMKSWNHLNKSHASSFLVLRICFCFLILNEIYWAQLPGRHLLFSYQLINQKVKLI